MTKFAAQSREDLSCSRSIETCSSSSRTRVLFGPRLRLQKQWSE